MLHIRMGTLHDCHVLGTLGYDTGKYRTCEKILCNIFPLKREGGTRSDG